jgi:ABC-type phosphate transport system substrate-binding protein
MKLRLIAAALAANLVAITAAIALDANLPAYQAVSGVSGQIKSVGSDTLNNEMELWAKGFEALYPGVTIEIEGKGSATAPPALLEGASQFAPMSRPMTKGEIDAFEKKYGYKPAHFRVAADALAIYVNNHPVFDDAASGSDFLCDAARQWKPEHRYLGRRWPDRRMGDKTNRDLRPQFPFRNLRVFQEHCFIQRRV